jgi:hypothetical protein
MRERPQGIYIHLECPSDIDLALMLIERNAINNNVRIQINDLLNRLYITDIADVVNLIGGRSILSFRLPSTKRMNRLQLFQ